MSQHQRSDRYPITLYYDIIAVEDTIVRFTTGWEPTLSSIDCPEISGIIINIIKHIVLALRRRRAGGSVSILRKPSWSAHILQVKRYFSHSSIFSNSKHVCPWGAEGRRYNEAESNQSKSHHYHNYCQTCYCAAPFLPMPNLRFFLLAPRYLHE